VKSAETYVPHSQQVIYSRLTLNPLVDRGLSISPISYGPPVLGTVREADH